MPVFRAVRAMPLDTPTRNDPPVVAAGGLTGIYFAPRAISICRDFACALGSRLMQWSMPHRVLQVVAGLIVLVAVSAFTMGVINAPQRGRMPGEKAAGAAGAAPIVATDATPLSQERIEGAPEPRELTPEEKEKAEAEKEARQEAAEAAKEAAATTPPGVVVSGAAQAPPTAPPPPEAPPAPSPDEAPH